MGQPMLMLLYNQWETLWRNYPSCIIYFRSRSDFAACPGDHADTAKIQARLAFLLIGARFPTPPFVINSACVVATNDGRIAHLALGGPIGDFGSRQAMSPKTISKSYPTIEYIHIWEDE